MPVKKISESSYSTIETKQTPLPQIDKNELRRAFETVNCIVLVIMILFGSSVCYQVYFDLEGHGKASNTDIKSCLVDFQERNCNPLQLVGECAQLYMCIQKQDSNGVLTQTWTILTVSIKTIKENIVLPSVCIAILLLYKIANHAAKKEENENKND